MEVIMTTSNYDRWLNEGIDEMYAPETVCALCGEELTTLEEEEDGLCRFCKEAE
jgi:hypothetical protein